MTFYDYDMIIRRDSVTHVLRANMKALPGGHRCVVAETEHGSWERVTRWHSKHGTRYVHYPTLDEALTAGVKWARRREQKDLRDLREKGNR